MVQLRPITSPAGLKWYSDLAGGTGLVIVEATGVPLFGDTLSVQKLARLAEAIHGQGALAAVQLFPLAHLKEPAAPDSLSAADIILILEQFAHAAKICRDAGFDGVEPHGAHGFLINQFFMPGKNHRTDGYGGSPDARGRFAVEICRSIKQAVSDDLLLLYRHTPTGDDYSIDDSLAFAHSLADAGIDILDVSPARGRVAAELAAPFKKTLPVPVIAVGGMEDPDAASEALAERRCDMAALGRALIADPLWPEKVRDERIDEIFQCVKCNGCFEYLHAGEQVSCAQR